MKTSRHWKTRIPEEVFAATLVVLLLIVLPMLGAPAMVGGAAIGLATYMALFPNRFRSRNGSLKMAVCLMVSLLIAAVVVVVLALS